MGKTGLIGNVIALAGIVACQPACSVSLIDVDNARVKGLAYLFKSQKGDGTWSTHDSLKVQTTATVLEALINSGIRSGETYGAAAAWLANAETASVDSTARKIAALSGTGMNMQSRVQALLATRPLMDRQIWGAYPQYEMSFPDTPLSIAAVRLSGYVYANQSSELNRALACEVLPAQKAEISGKGWSYTRAATNETTQTNFGSSALLPTAITLLEIATLKTVNNWTTSSFAGCSSYNLSTVLNDGVTYLLTKKNADNGFGENGASTPLQTALVYQAIQAVSASHSALPLAQDYLINAQSLDGSWGGNPLATAWVLKTLPVLNTNDLADTDRDGVPDEIELAMNSDTLPTIADGRNMLAPGNGQTVAGLDSPLFATSIRYLHPMSPVQLFPASATAYAISSGTLPPSVTMSEIGILSGIPTQIGTFGFSYSVAGGPAVLAQLIVAPPDGDLNDDGQVDVADVALLERILLGHVTATALQQVSADVTPVGEPDSAVDLTDLQRLKRMALGLE